MATELRRITAVTAVTAVPALPAVTAVTDRFAALHMFARLYAVSQSYSGMPIVRARHGPVTRSVIIFGPSARIVRLQRSTNQRRSNRRFCVETAMAGKGA
ncbi:hypothetical protein GCM10009102_28710 [Sphingomonas insulae]|uniref:Secreted protein n=1 Tax=Sphingomonas insulae TaxID=424800 RepID=A0ABN1HZ22_9SPHN